MAQIARMFSGERQREKERWIEPRVSEGEKTARPTTVSLSSAAVAKPVLRLHSLFIRCVCVCVWRDGVRSNERSLLERAPTVETERDDDDDDDGGDRRDLHPLCVISLRY